jgi:hypothetical protein
VDLLTLGLNKWVRGCHGIMFVKVRVLKPKRSLRKLVSEESAIS